MSCSFGVKLCQQFSKSAYKVGRFLFVQLATLQVISNALEIDQLQVLFGPVAVQPDAAHHAHTRQPAAQVCIILCMHNSIRGAANCPRLNEHS